MKKNLWLLLLILSASVITAQPCAVNIDSLKGRYTGDCKKGVANGMGTATGVDSYTGHFKNGYPEGEGKYTWRNGSWYDGGWKNGLFNGNGTLSKVDDNKPDSATLITGFWEEGKYISNYQKAYTIYGLTNGISDAVLRKAKKTKNLIPEITITVKSITGGGSSLGTAGVPAPNGGSGKGALLAKPRLKDVQVIQGLFQQLVNNETSTVSNKYILRHVVFPFIAILSFETDGINSPMPIERVRVELTERGDWYVNVSIDN